MSTPQEDLWTAVRLMAEGSDWKRDQGETLTAWAQRTLQAPRPEVELLAALKLARLFIRRSQIERAVVDMDKPNVGIGEYLDGVIERHAPQPSVPPK